MLINQEFRKLLHIYFRDPLVANDDKDIEEISSSLKHLAKEFNWNAELMAIQMKVYSEAKKLSYGETKALESILRKVANERSSEKLTTNEKIQAFIEYYERDPFGINVQQLKEAYYTLRRNDFVVPGFRNLG